MTVRGVYMTPLAGTGSARLSGAGFVPDCTMAACRDGHISCSTTLATLLASTTRSAGTERRCTDCTPSMSQRRRMHGFNAPGGVCPSRM